MKSPLPYYYAGFVIVLALIIGGGTEQGIWTDHLLEIVMLPALFWGLGGFSSSRFGNGSRFLVIVIFCLLFAQFIPLERALPLPDVVQGIGKISLFSPAPQRSLEAALFASSLIGFALFVSRLTDRYQQGLLRFVFFGFAINIFAGILELSYSQQQFVHTGILPYYLAAGLFVNDNHFASLIYAMIPLIAYQFLARSSQIWIYLTATILIVFFSFAVGSRAGIAISLALSALCLFWFLTKSFSYAVRISLFLAGVVGLLAILALHGFDDPLKGDLRETYYATTWRAIEDHWLTGTGLGTFTLVYPAYELRENITDLYANHVHNDYLELLLETGIAGIVLIAAYFLLVLRNFTRSALAEACAFSILALAIHSLVDYPLRTMALGVIFSYLSAVVLSSRPESRSAHSGTAGQGEAGSPDRG